MTEKININLTIPFELGGMRVDKALVSLLPDYSRSQIQEWIKNSQVKLNDLPIKSKLTLAGGEQISISASPRKYPVYEAQKIALDIIYEDDDLMVINKPAGMVVHPAAGNPNHTLLNALLNHSAQLQDLPRAGIIHRLDKDTTGLLVIAKNNVTLHRLLHQMKKREIKRIYQAVVNGL